MTKINHGREAHAANTGGAGELTGSPPCASHLNPRRADAQPPPPR